MNYLKAREQYYADKTEKNKRLYKQYIIDAFKAWDFPDDFKSWFRDLNAIYGYMYMDLLLDHPNAQRLIWQLTQFDVNPNYYEYLSMSKDHWETVVKEAVKVYGMNPLCLVGINPLFDIYLFRLSTVEQRKTFRPKRSIWIKNEILDEYPDTVIHHEKMTDYFVQNNYRDMVLFSRYGKNYRIESWGEVEIDRLFLFYQMFTSVPVSRTDLFNPFLRVNSNLPIPKWHTQVSNIIMFLAVEVRRSRPVVWLTKDLIRMLFIM